MKRFFRFMMAAAVIFSAVSCAKENVSVAPEGQEVEVSFVADLGGALGSRAIADGTTVDEVAWAVYEDGANAPLEKLQGTLEIPDKQKQATLIVRLATGKTYDIAFFAYKKDDENGGPLHYSVSWDEKKVSMKLDPQPSANDESFDCFWYVEHDYTVKGSNSETFPLTRPLAQLNLGVNAKDVDDAKDAGFEVSNTQITVNTYTQFNMFDGSLYEQASIPVTFKSAKSPIDSKNVLNIQNDNNVYKYLATTYVLVGENKVTSDVSVTIWNKNEADQNTINYSYVPLQRNYRTNIIGNLLTSPSIFTIVIDERFEVPDHIYVPKEDYVMCDGYMEVSNERGLLKWAYIAKYEDKNMGLKLVDNIVLPAKEIAVDNANKTYVYTDTDITVTEGIPSGNNWPILSDYETSYNAETGLYEYFGGAIDGDNFTISGLRINHDLGASGFLCWTKGATVDNLTFDDAVVYNAGGNLGESYTGIVIGRCWDGSHVNNVHITNSSVTGLRNEVGGIVGRVYHRTIKSDGTEFREALAYVVHCTTDENTTVTGASCVGGIVGMNYGCVVGQCINNADVTGVDKVGGIAGFHRSYTTNTDAYLIGCRTTNKATIKATNGTAAGFAGYVVRDGNHLNTKSWIVGCACESNIEGNYVGSMVGYDQGWGCGLSACWAVTNLSAFHATGTAPEIDAAYNYASATDATQADVDAMNAAIEAFNVSDHNISIDGVSKGAEMHKRWVRTEAGVLVLQ